ncbi:hypothetical protein PG996_013601 [Apiospora saccharicola]|uniref:Mtf2-like C-terminal domain-containing protein n=1 Tax=Apiospora saccharicola TaxID=335842 RepID=A0ABR1U5X7_9PEZI
MSTSYLPFLYQTRTILRTRLPLNRTVARALHTTPTCLSKKRDAHIPFEIGVKPEEDAIPDPGAKGTITPTERQTFDRIFADIAARGAIPRLNDDLPSPSPTARRSTNFILNAAANDAVPTRNELVASPAQLAGASKDRSKALLRFPPSLRAAANRAFNILQPNHPSDDNMGSIGQQGSQTDVDDTPNNFILHMVEMDAKRQPEENRINQLMENATSEFKLWDVLEEEVFSLPAKFGLVLEPDTREKRIIEQQVIEGNRAARRKSLKKKTSNKKIKEVLEDRSRELSEEELVERRQNMYQYGPLYPAFLLKGLRLLDTKFPMSSRLTLSVLPRVKELGLESFVLGVSTPFYNELLRIYYHRYGDLEKMLDLLEEMRHSGLYFDEGTAAILNQVHQQTRNLANGDFGPFGQAIMSMPEYEYSVRTRIGHWHRGVDISIKQRDQDIDYQKLGSGV